MGDRIAPGSPLILDLERAHGVPVRDDGLESGAHRAYDNDPVYLKRMEMANDLCSWLKRYLWRFTGMSPRNLQAYLDWYVYQARDRWDQTARAVRHVLMAERHTAAWGRCGKSRYLTHCITNHPVIHQFTQHHIGPASCIWRRIAPRLFCKHRVMYEAARALSFSKRSFRLSGSCNFS